MIMIMMNEILLNDENILWMVMRNMRMMSMNMRMVCENNDNTDNDDEYEYEDGM